jgi:hypothetical protein
VDDIRQASHVASDANNCENLVIVIEKLAKLPKAIGSVFGFLIGSSKRMSE